MLINSASRLVDNCNSTDTEISIEGENDTSQERHFPLLNTLWKLTKLLAALIPAVVAGPTNSLRRLYV